MTCLVPSFVPWLDATRDLEALTEKKKSKWVLDEYNLLVDKHGRLT